MNKKLLSTTLILAICAVFFSCSKSQSITLEYKLDSDAKTLLGEQNIKCKKRRIKINSAQISENEKSALEILLQYYTQKIDAEIENLANANNADFKNSGHQYFRKIVSLSKGGKITIPEDSEHFRLEYEPQNPNAKTEGELKGFVVYPNVDTGNEAKELLENIRIQKELEAAVQK